jgi:hypothetical protein
MKLAQTTLRLATTTARKLEEARSSRMKNPRFRDHPLGRAARGRLLVVETLLDPQIRFSLPSWNSENGFIR